jgi:hypothetical protein
MNAMGCADDFETDPEESATSEDHQSIVSANAPSSKGRDKTNYETKSNKSNLLRKFTSTFKKIRAESPVKQVEVEEVKIEEPPEPEPIAPEEVKSSDIWQNTKNDILNFGPELKRIENERLAKIQEIIPRFNDGFNLPVYDRTVKNCPLKHFVKSFFYNESKF